MTASADVRLAGVTKRYGDRTVLDGIDLDVAGGELVALLGPSGCGKTTVLRLIAGFEQMDGGHVSIDGRDVSTISARRRGVGIVFQAYSLFPHLTALENVAYGLRVRGVARAVRTGRAAEILDLVGLSKHGEKYPGQLSGGQQQRVALARAFAIEPRVLLLDEPLSALDAKVRVQLRDEIRRLQRTMGMTTIMVTHDQEEALTMADRVAVMRDGRIDQIGTPEDVYRRPETPFVSSFVGVVNRVPARVGPGGVEALGLTVPVARRAAFDGGRGDALVRPEDLALDADPAGEAVVDAITLRGAVTSVTVLHRDLSDPLRIDMHSGDARGWRVGERGRIRLLAEDVMLDAPREGQSA